MNWICQKKAQPIFWRQQNIRNPTHSLTFMSLGQHSIHFTALAACKTAANLRSGLRSLPSTIRYSSRTSMAPNEAIHLDGRTGEGGGQLVRIAIALASVACKPVKITDVRGNRPGPRGGGNYTNGAPNAYRASPFILELIVTTFRPQVTALHFHRVARQGDRGRRQRPRGRQQDTRVPT